MSEPLKSCPFCGGVPTLTLTKVAAWCATEGCPLHRTSVPVAAWNTRAVACAYSEEFDATDGSCPAWWRGHHHGYAAAQNTRAASLPWKALAKRLRADVAYHVETCRDMTQMYVEASNELDRYRRERDERIAAAEPVMWNASQAVRDYSNAAQASIEPRPAEAKACHPLCGELVRSNSLVFDEVLCWVPADHDRAWCSPECRDAGKPVNPRGAR